MALPAHGPREPPLLRLLQPLLQSFCPPGLQRAPCGCCFDPRVFCVQWTIPYNHPGAAAAAAPPVLPAPVPSYQHLEGHLARLDICSEASAAGTPPGSHGHPGCSAAPHNGATGDPGSRPAVPEHVLLEDALRLFGCLVDAGGVSEEDLSSVPKPEAGDAIAAAPQRDLSALALPQELLTPDYSGPEVRAAVLSMDEFYILGMEPPELWDTGTELLPPPGCPSRAAGAQMGAEPRARAPQQAQVGVGGGD